MTHDAARRRFFFILLPALLFLLLLALACGSSGEAVPECQDIQESDACNSCCVSHGYHGHISGFGSPNCRCL